MFRVKSECDVCGFEHPALGDNRAFRWCRRIRGTMNNIIEQIKERIAERDKEYESIHSGEVVLTKE